MRARHARRLTLLAVAAICSTTACRQERATEGLTRGGEVYLAYCAVCHGAEGAGDGPLASRLSAEGAKAPPRLDDRVRIEALGRAGVKEMVTGGDHASRPSTMPLWGPHLGSELSGQVTDFVVALPARHPAARAAIARYLAPPAGTPPTGRRDYVLYCSGCHGPDGDGKGLFSPRLARRLVPANLTDSARVASLSDAELRELIGLGDAHAEEAPTVPGWINSFDSTSHAAIAAYVRHIAR